MNDNDTNNGKELERKIKQKCTIGFDVTESEENLKIWIRLSNSQWIFWPM